MVAFYCFSFGVLLGLFLVFLVVVVVLSFWCFDVWLLLLFLLLFLPVHPNRQKKT